MNIEKFGPFLQSCRKRKQMTQGELAQKLHVTDKAVSRWERGVGFPDIKLLEPLAEALDISVAELLRAERLDSEQMAEVPMTVPQALIEVFADEGKRMALYKRGVAICKLVTFILVGILAYYASQVPEPWWVHPVALILVWLSRIFVERLLKLILRQGKHKKQPVSYHVMFAVFGAGVMMSVFQRTIESCFGDLMASHWDFMSSVMRLVGLVGMLFTDNQIDT